MLGIRELNPNDTESGLFSEKYKIHLTNVNETNLIHKKDNIIRVGMCYAIVLIGIYILSHSSIISSPRLNPNRLTPRRSVMINVVGVDHIFDL